MKNQRFTIFTAVFLFIVLSSGCAINRSEIELNIPEAVEIPMKTGKTVFIKSVVDNRIFEKRPKVPNIPSLNPSKERNKDIEKRAVARKRNGYGKAIGDILLKEGQTVESVIRESLKQGFLENGFDVLENAEQSSPSTYIVDAKINKFWSWMNPGFWTISLSTEINTDIQLKKSTEGRTETISVEFTKCNISKRKHFQTAIDGNWIKVMQGALNEFIAKVKKQLE
jgi:hypothetical protein